MLFDSTAINGFVFAAAIQTTGKLHMAPLHTDVPSGRASVPGPGSLALLATGLIGLGIATGKHQWS